MQACKEYLKALEVMEGYFEEKELIGNKAKFMALTYAHLTKLFSDLYLHEQAIYFGKLSQHYFQIQESSSWHLSWALNEIGSHFDIMNELDSAEYYYKQAKAVLNDTNSILYALGAVLFTLSDIVLIFNTFGGATKYSMRITNLSLYYIGQLLIALSLFFI